MSFAGPHRSNATGRGPDAAKNQLHRMLMDSWACHFKQHKQVLALLEAHPEYVREADEVHARTHHTPHTRKELMRPGCASCGSTATTPPTMSAPLAA